MAATESPATSSQQDATASARPSWLRWLGLAALALAAVAAVLVLNRDDAPLPGVVREPPIAVDGLELVDYDDIDDGEVVDLAPPADGVSLVYFGYMNCPDVCPTTLADIRVALQQLGDEKAEDVTVAFVTVDPERDTGENMRDYLQLFYPDLPNDTAALRTDGPTTLDELVDRFNLYVEIEDHEEGAERYDVGHSAVTYVVDDSGAVVRELPFGATPDDFARVIDHVLSGATSA